MKGSIRFNNDINVEVSVDPTAEEGARLESAKNLVDGQELGTGGGGGYDAEFTIYHSGNSSDPYVLTRVSGDFATLKSMYESHTTPVILVRINDSLNDVYTATTNVSLYDILAGFLNLFVQATTNLFTPNVPFKTYSYIHWNTDDTITMS